MTIVWQILMRSEKAAKNCRLLQIIGLLWNLSLSCWYPGSGVVLDCIDSWSLYPYLLLSLNMIWMLNMIWITKTYVEGTERTVSQFFEAPKNKLMDNKIIFGDIYNQWRPRSDTAELCSVWSLFAHYVLLTLCIRETPKRVHLRTVKTLIKCSIILHFIRVYTVKVKKIFRQKNTIFKKIYNLTPLDRYNGLSQVYCIKPERIHLCTKGQNLNKNEIYHITTLKLEMDPSI